MQFKAFEPGILVNGQTVYAIVDGFAFFKHAVSKIMVAEGIGEIGSDGTYKLDSGAWYSQEAWLRCFGRVAANAGASALFKIGQKIPENAQFPPWVVDIHSAIRSVNIAYHMNHKKNGRVMFDPSTSEMLEGIGSYGYQAVSGQRRIISECKNPYPCEFDHGILTTMARKFEAGAKVTHDDSKPCRRQGADSCTYLVSW